jgi:hypothetical protein
MRYTLSWGLGLCGKWIWGFFIKKDGVSRGILGEMRYKSEGYNLRRGG